jgi:DNA topoisomerase-1
MSRAAAETPPGFTRGLTRGSFQYLDAKGRRIASAETLRRIEALVIPPAWSDVWISPDPRSHLQATGRDERGRKQYLYHDAWRSDRERAKFERVARFGRRLAVIRRQVQTDLQQPGLPKTKVLAAIVCLLDTALIRIGNSEYARQNGTFGLTTLRSRHVKVCGASIRFCFRGKSGLKRTIDVVDRALARLISKCKTQAKGELFHYRGPDGRPMDVKSKDVNAYLRGIAGEEFSAKDFRTWAATVQALTCLERTGEASSKTAACRNVAAAIREVSAALGNTPRVCRASYVHPAIIQAYLDRTLGRARRPAVNARSSEATCMRPEERRVLRMLGGGGNGGCSGRPRTSRVVDARRPRAADVSRAFHVAGANQARAGASKTLPRAH